MQVVVFPLLSLMGPFGMDFQGSGDEAQMDADQHFGAEAGNADLATAAPGKHGNSEGLFDTSPNKASTCSGQTCHDQPSSAEQTPHGSPGHAHTTVSRVEATRQISSCLLGCRFDGSLIRHKIHCMPIPCKKPTIMCTFTSSRVA